MYICITYFLKNICTPNLTQYTLNKIWWKFVESVEIFSSKWSTLYCSNLGCQDFILCRKYVAVKYVWRISSYEKVFERHKTILSRKVQVVLYFITSKYEQKFQCIPRFLIYEQTTQINTPFHYTFNWKYLIVTAKYFPCIESEVSLPIHIETKAY